MTTIGSTKLGDVTCVTVADEGEKKPICAAPVGRLAVIATGKGGVAAQQVVDNGIVKLVDWVRNADQSG